MSVYGVGVDSEDRKVEQEEMKNKGCTERGNGPKKKAESKEGREGGEEKGDG